MADWFRRLFPHKHNYNRHLYTYYPLSEYYGVNGKIYSCKCGHEMDEFTTKLGLDNRVTDFYYERWKKILDERKLNVST